MSHEKRVADEKRSKIFVKATFISSIFAGIIGKIICHPVDTIRAKLQVTREYMTLSSYKESLIIQTYKNTIKNEGFRGLYRGLGICIVGTGPAFSLYLTTYEMAKSRLSQIKFFRENSGTCYFLSGLIAESISCIFWLPIDVVKERQQVQKNLGFYNYKNGLDAIQTILKTEGIVGLYRAYGATIASFGPFSAMYFLFYEKLKNSLCENPANPSFLQSLSIAGLSGSIAGYLVNPLEIVKLRMQVQRASKASRDPQAQLKGNFGYKNIFNGLFLMIRNEGFASLYKGSLAKVLYTAPNSAICMSLSEVVRSQYMKQYDLKH